MLLLNTKNFGVKTKLFQVNIFLRIKVYQMKKILITTVPFASQNNLPIELLDNLNKEYIINPLNKKLTESELLEMTSDVDIIIAGTEPITKKVICNAPNLKMISRVGIGLDSVDLLAAKDLGIKCWSNHEYYLSLFCFFSNWYN